MTIHEQLVQLAAIVEPWGATTANVSALERDLVLEKLRAIYQTVLSGDTQPASPLPAPSKATPPYQLPDAPPSPSAPLDAFDFEPADGPSLFDAALDVAPPVSTPSQPASSQPAPSQPAPEGRPGRIDKRVILSLYGDSPTGSPAAAPAPAQGESPDFEVIGSRAAATSGPVLGETVGVVSLRQGIGINDKFLIISEVFNGSAQAYERAISDLEGFSDLDEAMIHIHENYAWNPHNEGVKVLIDILTRKLS